VKLDLACGEDCLEGFEGVDVVHNPGVVHLVDLLQYGFFCKAPFHPDHSWASDSVDELHCSHFVEHVPNLVQFMNECHRILKPGGIFKIRHPHQFSLGAWQDPTHVRALNEVSWWYYNAAWREQMKLGHYLGIEADFDYLDCVPVPDEAYADATPESFQRSIRKFNNVCLELHITLRKRGGPPDVDDS